MVEEVLEAEEERMVKILDVEEILGVIQLAASANFVVKWATLDGNASIGLTSHSKI